MKAVTLTESGLNPAVQHSETTCACNKIFVALSVIAALGLFLASAIGGVGLFMQGAPQWIATIGPVGQWVMLVGGGLLGAGAAGYSFYGIFKKESGEVAGNNIHQSHKYNAEALAAVFQETKDAYENGYMNSSGELVSIDNKKMLKGTKTFIRGPEITCSSVHETQFLVDTRDTLNVLTMLRGLGHYPVGINMANAHHPGGGVERGMPAQEEEICRRTNHYMALEHEKQKGNYPLPEVGGIYCPDVQVFRRDRASNFEFFDYHQSVALVAVAAFDLREGDYSNRENLGLPLKGALSEDVLLQNQNYIEKTKDKIRNTLRMMHFKGHTHIVLGALGCGAFQNPPRVIARFFVEVFKEEEFSGAFEKVYFAILKLSEKDQNNIDAFNEICTELNKHKNS